MSSVARMRTPLLLGWSRFMPPILHVRASTSSNPQPLPRIHFLKRFLGQAPDRLVFLNVVENVLQAVLRRRGRLANVGQGSNGRFPLVVVLVVDQADDFRD